MLDVETLKPSLSALTQIEMERMQRTIDENRLVPAPASPLASPIESARIEVNQAAQMLALMNPSRDGIYAIGPAAVKVGSSMTITPSRSFNSWGF